MLEQGCPWQLPKRSTRLISGRFAGFGAGSGRDGACALVCLQLVTTHFRNHRGRNNYAVDAWLPQPAHDHKPARTRFIDHSHLLVVDLVRMLDPPEQLLQRMQISADRSMRTHFPGTPLLGDRYGDAFLVDVQSDEQSRFCCGRFGMVFH